MKYLVTGGAGYVGSHLALNLVDLGHEVVVLDDLSLGHRAAIPHGARFLEVDLTDAAATERAVAMQSWDAVLHFASLSLVGESMREPFRYLRTNLVAALNLIDACARHGVRRFVLSSTASLFGDDGHDGLILNDADVDPGSPYGESKYLIERSLVWADRIYGMKSACLRYFNTAGADPAGRLGEDHRPETHLVPLAIDAALGRRAGLKLFGNDYPTPDGTCIRDYIHVTDLADAHVLAMKRLDETSVTYNLGNGIGFSNLEVIRSVERVTGRKIPWDWAPRRPGDPAVLVADSTCFRRDTGWSPRFATLDEIVRTALRWREVHPEGYATVG